MAYPPPEIVLITTLPHPAVAGRPIQSFFLQQAAAVRLPCNVIRALLLPTHPATAALFGAVLAIPAILTGIAAFGTGAGSFHTGFTAAALCQQLMIRVGGCAGTQQAQCQGSKYTVHSIFYLLQRLPVSLAAAIPVHRYFAQCTTHRRVSLIW